MWSRSDTEPRSSRCQCCRRIYLHPRFLLHLISHICEGLRSRESFLKKVLRKRLKFLEFPLSAKGLAQTKERQRSVSDPSQRPTANGNVRVIQVNWVMLLRGLLFRGAAPDFFEMACDQSPCSRSCACSHRCKAKAHAFPRSPKLPPQLQSPALSAP
jgi:hypothetical protein